MILDFVLIVLLAGFVLFGLWFGFVHTLGALAGTVVGAFAAGRFYEPIASFFSGTFGWDHNLMRVIAFLVLFVLVNRLVGLLFYLVERTFRFISIIPFLGAIDHLLGVILGFFEGALVLGLTLYFATKFPVGPLAAMITGSSVAKWLIATASVLIPLLPKFVQGLQGML
jgi:membrane protein required for colicin V production